MHTVKEKNKDRAILILLLRPRKFRIRRLEVFEKIMAEVNPLFMNQYLKPFYSSVVRLNQQLAEG
jgi:hypothetical protein